MGSTRIFKTNVEAPYFAPPYRQCLSKQPHYGFLLLCLVTATIFLNACNDYRPRIDKKTFTSMKDSLLFSGRWKQTDSVKSTSHMAEINTLTVSCSKIELTCEEWIANAFPEWLYLHREVYTVMEWDDLRVLARSEAPVADIELRISLVDKSVERTFRGTNARRVDKTDIDGLEQWVLE